MTDMDSQCRNLVIVSKQNIQKCTNYSCHDVIASGYGSFFKGLLILLLESEMLKLKSAVCDSLLFIFKIIEV